jgi:ankyrin repeat protein
MNQDANRKRKADILGRWETSSKLGRGSLSGWTTCPLCPTNRKKQYALGRGIAAHLHAVHAPWKIKEEKSKSPKRPRTNAGGNESTQATCEQWDPTPQEDEEWSKRVAEITAELERSYQGKVGTDRTGKVTKSYRESLPTFLQAAADGNIVQLQSMLSHASQVKGGLAELLSTRDRNGSTPEHWAAGGGHMDCLKILLESREKVCEGTATGPDPPFEPHPNKRPRRRDGKTSLHYAARNGKLECMRYLVEDRDHSVDIRSGDGSTPLHLACFGAYPQAVRYLIDKGADIHAINDWSCSAAHWTAMSQSQDADAMVAICQLLHKAGVSFVVAQKQGHSPLHKAAQKQNQIVAKWLSKSIECGGPGLTPAERSKASKPDNGGHRPSDIWLSAGGESSFASWINEAFET